MSKRAIDVPLWKKAKSLKFAKSNGYATRWFKFDRALHVSAQLACVAAAAYEPFATLRSSISKGLRYVRGNQGRY